MKSERSFKIDDLQFIQSFFCERKCPLNQGNSKDIMCAAPGSECPVNDFIAYIHDKTCEKEATCKFNKCRYFTGVVQRNTDNTPYLIGCGLGKHMRVRRKPAMIDEDEYISSSYSDVKVVCTMNEDYCPRVIPFNKKEEEDD